MKKFMEVLYKNRFVLICMAFIVFFLYVAKVYSSLLDAVLLYLSFIIVCVTVNNDYSRTLQRIYCILLSVLILLATIFVGVSISDILALTGSALIIGEIGHLFVLISNNTRRPKF